MAAYEFHYPSQLASEERMLDDVEAALVAERIDLDACHRFRLAVSEAFTNALVHGNHSDPAKQVTVRLRVNETTLAADIIDEGQGGLQRLRSRQPRGLLADGGRGIDLIERFAETVEYAEEAHGGLRVSFTFAKTKQTHVRL